MAACPILVFRLFVRPEYAILVFMYRTQDLHVKEIVPLLPPRAIKAHVPVSEAVNATVARSRERIVRILRQEDPRLLVVIGPCSIHDEKSALEYAERLNALRKEFADRMEIIMRVYFEKPRTTIGWKGLINDPHLDNSHDIETGLKTARRLLLDIADMGLPAPAISSEPNTSVFLSQNVGSPEEVDMATAGFVTAGGRVVKEPQNAAFGGYHSAVADLDGLIWEIAYNPGLTVADDGTVRIVPIT